MQIQFKDQNAIGGNIEELRTAWAVAIYNVHYGPNAAPTVLWVGAVRLRDLFTFSEVNNNSHWRKLVRPVDTVSVAVHATGTKVECMVEMGRFMKTIPLPPCNAQGWNVIGLARPVHCITNGITYPNQTEAARALKINQGALSRHLRGELRHVKQYIFTRPE